MKKSTNKQTGAVNKVLIVAGAIVVLIIVFFAATGTFKFDVSYNKPADNESAEYKTFDQDGVSFNYPGSWESGDVSGSLGGFFSPSEGSNDTFRENVIVFKIDVSVKPDLTLEELTDSLIKENEEDFATGTFELVDRSPTTLGGIDAEKVTYLAGDANLADGKAMSVVALKDNFAYVINYTAEQKSFDKFLTDTELIISSFQIQ
jgi:hypothetical protein